MNKSNVKQFFGIIKLIYDIRKSFLPLTIIENIIAALIPFINLILGAKIIDGIVNKESEMYLIKTAMILVTLNMICALIRWGIDKILIVMKRSIDEVVFLKVADKSLTMDYQVMEKTETLDYINKAKAGSSSHGGITMYCDTIGTVLRNIVTIVYSLIVLAEFVTSNKGINGSAAFLKVVNSYWYVVLMFVLIVLVIGYNYYIFKTINKLQYKFFEDNVRGNREFSHFFDYLYDYQLGKQVRIYDMLGLIMEKVNSRGKDLSGESKKIARKSSFLTSQGQLVFAILLFISYIFVGAKAVSGSISIGMLTLYVGALTSFAEATMDIFWNYSTISIRNKYLSNYIEFLNIKNEKYDGTLPIEKRLDNDYELEFRDVSFHYPNSEEMVLNHISAKIRVGKKMAIVGRNGSGKSTFIKLLCRLYDPTEGEILLNGIDIRKYDYDEYRDIFGVVFQDFRLFSFSIGQNVAAGVEYDEEKVWRCLEQAGMKERVSEMKNGLEEYVYKQEDEGVEISGGEAQKLAIARALYKDAPVVILDEPTAALDPVSELEIYEKFDAMVNEKTAIYISHRMSSCRFCENIVVFDKGKIIQMGAHEELVEQKNNLYYELWNAQSKYYS